MTTSSDDRQQRAQLVEKVIEQAQTLHALKSAALRMFESMVEAVREERDGDALSEVQDLLEKMTGNFGAHEETTRDHERRLRERLEALGAGPSKAREGGLGAAAVIRTVTGRAGGQNYGSNARDAFVFEHVEMASAELLALVADRAGDERTAQIAREIRDDDEEMAAMIRRNLPNVLTLMLASEGLPAVREPAASADAAGDQPAEEGGS